MSEDIGQKRTLEEIDDYDDDDNKNESSFKKNTVDDVYESIGLRLGSLDPQLLGQIGSYLSQSSYAKFSRTNTTLLKACNSPNRLRQLILAHSYIGVTNRIDNIDYTSVNLGKYHSMEYLSIAIQIFNQLQLNAKVGRHLRSLHIDGRPGSTDININPFMNQQLLTFDNLRNLYLTNWGDLRNHAGFNMDTFCRFLSKFPMIHTLEITRVNLTRPIDINLLRQLLPNLKQLRLSQTNLTRNMINSFGSQLQKLSFEQYSLEIFDAQEVQINFKSLSTLSVTNVSMITIDSIFQTANALKSITYQPKGIAQRNTSDEQMKRIMSGIITQNALLEELTIPVFKYNVLKPILNGIELGLNKTKKFSRKQLRICIQIYFTSISDSVLGNEKLECKEFIMYISKFIDTLLASKVVAFVISWTWQYYHHSGHEMCAIDDTEMIKEVNELKMLTPEIKVNHEVRNDDISHGISMHHCVQIEKKGQIF